MFLSEIIIKGYRLFNEEVKISLNKGINLLVGENGCGKSSIIDAIRLLLNEDEYYRNGINEEDFYSSLDKKVLSDQILIKGKFKNLSEQEKVKYLTWLDNDYNAILNLKVLKKIDKRYHYKKSIWGGESSNSFFEWESLNDIQCVYLPALRDAERKLRASRGSRLARLLINLSENEMNEKRKAGELMKIEKQVNDFNEKLSNQDTIIEANKLINDSLKNALGTAFGQSTSLQFNEVKFERIVETLKLVFFPKLQINKDSIYRDLSENSLGYNNLIYLATILAEFEGLKDCYHCSRILLIEELEAYLHPQLQIKLLKYLEEQAEKNDIQVIITTHSPNMAAATPISNIISLNTLKNEEIVPVSLKSCKVDEKAEKFINRWLDTTKSTLLFSKGVVLVEGLAEAILVSKLAEIYLKKCKEKHGSLNIPSSLEEAGVSVINMRGIYFQYFMQLYRGYQLNIESRKEGESKGDYINRVKEFQKKEYYEEDEYSRTDYIPIRCVALTDNDPDNKSRSTFIL